MKKADLILVLAVVVVAAALFFWRFRIQENGTSVRVEVDGEVYGIYSLSEDQEIVINGTNTLVISDGEAYMSEATCPDKLCVHQGRISADGELIVCLPNRVVVQIEENDAEKEDDGVDVIAG